MPAKRRAIDVSKLAFPLLRTKRECKPGAVPAAIAQAQKDILRANHLVICYPPGLLLVTWLIYTSVVLRIHAPRRA